MSERAGSTAGKVAAHLNAGVGHKVVYAQVDGARPARAPDLTPLLTHKFSLDNITEAYKLFSDRREGVIKVAIKPEWVARKMRPAPEG